MMARRSIRKAKQFKLLGIIVSIALGFAVVRWLFYHWWALFLVLGALGYGIYHRWHMRQVWLDTLRRSGIADIDRMSGGRFEERLQLFFNDRGWHVQLTPASGDFGADLVGTDETGQRVVIQAKRYQDPVGVHAIQEVLGGKAHYGATRALVITNSTFTANARTLAQGAQVELWDRERLIQELASITSVH